MAGETWSDCRGDGAVAWDGRRARTLQLRVPAAMTVTPTPMPTPQPKPTTRCRLQSLRGLVLQLLNFVVATAGVALAAMRIQLPFVRALRIFMLFCILFSSLFYNAVYPIKIDTNEDIEFLNKSRFTIIILYLCFSLQCWKTL